MQDTDQNQIDPLQPAFYPQGQAVDQRVDADMLAPRNINGGTKRCGVNKQHHGCFAAADNRCVEAITHDHQNDDQKKDEAKESCQKPRQ